MNNLLKINPDIQLSYKRVAVNLRNKIIHAYDNINDVIIWKVVIEDLPLLQSEVKQYLKEE